MMAKKKADLSAFQVNKKPVPKAPRSPETEAEKAKRRLITKAFMVTPEAAQQFDILRAELGPGQGKGPALIAEALNLLFEKYGKPPIA